MSSAATAAPPAEEAPPEDLLLADDASGEGAWAIAWKQFKKRRLAVAALGLIFFLFFVAVFAPFLANDLPIYVRAALPARYEAAFWAYDDGQRVLAALLEAQPRDERKIAAVTANLFGRLEDAGYLLPDDQAKLVEAAAKEHRELLAAASAPGGKLDAARWSAIRERLEPLSPDGDVKVAPRAFWPIFRIIDRTEIFFLAAFVTALLAPLIWRAVDAYGRRRVIDPFNLAFAKLAILLVIPTVAAFAVPAISPRKEDPDRKLYKRLAAQASAGHADATFWFPPIPFGENENILEDQKSKPTWLLSEEERVARVVPDLVRKRDDERERSAHEKFPGLVAERAALAGALDRIAQDTLKQNIFVRMGRALSPSRDVVTMTARRAEIDRQVAAEIAKQPTTLDKQVAEEYDRHRSELRMHWLGTDTNGRDVLSRMVYGARVSMSVGFVAEGIAVAIGLVLGALAGYFRGWVDIALSRVIEVVICFPTFFFILTILAFLPQSIVNIMIVIGITGWPGVARLMRAEFLRLSGLDFVTAGKALGLSDTRIIFRHILPNGLAPILVSTTFGIAGAILVESALSFLGFGVPQPTASWGDTLNNGSSDPQGTWWLTIFPGTALFLTVTAYNLVGDAIRDATDPRLRQ